MAEQSGDRTEEATGKRQSEALQEGQLPRSQELNTAVLLLGSALVLNTAGVGLGRAVFDVFGFGITTMGSAAVDGPGMLTLIQVIGWKMLAAISVFLLSMGGIALVVAGTQGRGNLTWKPLQPKFSRLSPLAGLKKIFGVQSVAELVKSLLKLLVLGLAVWWAISAAWPDILALIQQEPVAILHVVRRYAIRLLVLAGGMYLVLGIADYWFSVWKNKRDMRMTKQEVKEEAKQQEVDPMIRARMRSLGRDRIRKQMFEQVPFADVVVTNPTHIAVALKYEQGTDVAPVVVAMGQNKVAERIKAIAAEHGVPRVENKPVARALLGSARVGEAIPQDLYVAIIEIYAFIIRQRQAGLQGRR